MMTMPQDSDRREPGTLNDSIMQAWASSQVSDICENPGEKVQQIWNFLSSEGYVIISSAKDRTLAELSQAATWMAMLAVGVWFVSHLSSLLLLLLWAACWVCVGLCLYKIGSTAVKDVFELVYPVSVDTDQPILESIDLEGVEKN